jgi:hypothetical protein
MQDGQRLLSDEECKSIIKTLGMKLSVRPKLIITRLLSDLDKDDLRVGFLSISSLECHIGVFRDNGLCNYRTGSRLTLDEENRLQKIDQNRLKSTDSEKLHYNKPVIGWPKNE